MKPIPPSSDAWACLVVPAVLAFLLWALWPSAADNRHWREITADLRSDR